MKAKVLFILSMLFLGLSLNSCKDKDDDYSKEQKENEQINNWIHGDMNLWYYWRDKMPSTRNLDFKEAPNDFFGKLLFSDDNFKGVGEDRFSWIMPSYVDLQNALTGVSSNEIGFEYMPFYVPDSGTEVQLYVVYIKKGTKAEKSGLKRGDVIRKVDGVTLTESNWFKAFSQDKSSCVLEGANFTGKITVEPTASYKGDPIYIDSIYNVGGKQFGYIMYNQFTMDNGDGSYIYDKKLASIFAEYDSKNITKLVLDLRYNGGGYTSCAQNIASALVPNRDIILAEKKIFCRKEFNSIIDAAAKSELDAADYDSFMNDYFKKDIERVNSDGTVTVMGSIPNYGSKINKLYILVGRNTASASELIINGLKPFMGDKIVLIGEPTYGKNVGSITLTDEKNTNNKWGMQPIVFKAYNNENNSDYGKGFTPKDEFIIGEFSNILELGLKPLGDKDELLLSRAIADITGQPYSAPLKSASDLKKPIGSSLVLKPGAYDMVINNKFQKIIDLRSLKQ